MVDFGALFGGFGSPLAALGGQSAPKGSILAYLPSAGGRGKREEPVSSILLALREKKEEENSLALATKRWCRKCSDAFDGAACPQGCPPFMYRDAIPEEAQAAIIARVHQQKREAEAERDA